MTKRIILFSMALLTVFLYSCSPKSVKVLNDNPTYKEVLSKWTKNSKIYNKLNSETLTFDVTYKSAEFKKSFTDEYSRLYGSGITNESVYSEALSNSNYSDNNMEFFFSTYMPNPKWNDFNKKDSIWNIFLVTDNGKKIKPSKVVLLDNKDARTEKFYPYIGPWSKAYVVTFPIREAKLTANSVNLMILGVKGLVEFNWEIQGTTE